MENGKMGEAEKTNNFLDMCGDPNTIILTKLSRQQEKGSPERIEAWTILLVAFVSKA